MQVKYLKDLQPFYTILLGKDQTEMGTAASRLRRVQPQPQSLPPQETRSLDRPGDGRMRSLPRRGGRHAGGVHWADSVAGGEGAGRSDDDDTHDGNWDDAAVEECVGLGLGFRFGV